MEKEITIKEYLLTKCNNVKWKIKYIENLLKLSNDELFEIAIQEQIPDDYDGMYTDKCGWRADISLFLLKHRLKMINWLS